MIIPLITLDDIGRMGSYGDLGISKDEFEVSERIANKYLQFLEFWIKK